MLNAIKLIAAPKLLPYALGAVAVVISALVAALIYSRLFVIPALQLDIANKQAELSKVRAERQAFESAVLAQNKEVERLAAGCRRASAAANMAGLRAAKAPTVSEALTAEELNRWLREVTQ